MLLGLAAVYFVGGAYYNMNQVRPGMWCAPCSWCFSQWRGADLATFMNQPGGDKDAILNNMPNKDFWNELVPLVKDCASRSLSCALWVQTQKPERARA